MFSRLRYKKSKIKTAMKNNLNGIIDQTQPGAKTYLTA